MILINLEEWHLMIYRSNPHLRILGAIRLRPVLLMETVRELRISTTGVSLPNS